MIFSTWFTVEDPGKIGFPAVISARMHPKLHMSIPLVYLLLAIRISGARYHLVAT
jgi:hypothetical protein